MQTEIKIEISDKELEKQYEALVREQVKSAANRYLNSSNFREIVSESIRTFVNSKEFKAIVDEEINNLPKIREIVKEDLSKKISRRLNKLLKDDNIVP